MMRTAESLIGAEFTIGGIGGAHIRVLRAADMVSGGRINTGDDGGANLVVMLVESWKRDYAAYAICAMAYEEGIGGRLSIDTSKVIINGRRENTVFFNTSSPPGRKDEGYRKIVKDYEGLVADVRGNFLFDDVLHVEEV